jgi:hypothetical protein
MVRQLSSILLVNELSGVVALVVNQLCAGCWIAGESVPGGIQWDTGRCLVRLV